MFAFLKSLFGSSSPSAPGPKRSNSPTGRAALEDTSRKVIKLLTDWESLGDTLAGPDRQPELFSLPDAAITALIKQGRARYSQWDAAAWEAQAKAVVAVLVDFVVAQPKTVQILTHIINRHAEYELLLVTSVEQWGFKELFTEDHSLRLQEMLVIALAPALADKAEAIAQAEGGYVPKTLKDAVSKRLYIEHVNIASSGEWRPRQLVFLAKRRFDDNSLSRNIVIRDCAPGERRDPKEGIMFCEGKSATERKDFADMEHHPVTRRLFPESYWFYFSCYPSKDLPLRIIDFYPPEGTRWTRAIRDWARENRLRPRDSRTAEQVATGIREMYGPGRVEATYYVQDAAALLGWEAKQDRDRKGVLELVAWALPSGPDSAPSVRLFEPTPFDHLRTSRLLVIPAHAGSQTEDATGSTVEPLKCVEDAVSASPELARVWQALKLAGTESRALALINFCENDPTGTAKGTWSYHLFRGDGLDPSVDIRIAPYAEAIGPQGKPTAQTIAALAGHEPPMQPDIIFDRNKGRQQRGLPLLDLVQFITIGSAAKGWLFFRLNPGSMAVPLDEEQATASSEGTGTIHARIVKFCADRLKVFDLKAPAAAYTQGDLLIGESDADPANPGRRHYIKVFFSRHLSEHQNALPISWDRLANQQPCLLPPGASRYRINHRGTECTGKDRPTSWIIDTPEYQTLFEHLLERRAIDDLDCLYCTDLAVALRRFYRSALTAGVAFPDCSVGDLLIGQDRDAPAGLGIWLVDYGSYRPYETYMPDVRPGKDDYRDPGLIHYLENGGDPAFVREQAHSYNLGLLEYYIWSGGNPPPWPAQFQELSRDPARYEEKVSLAFTALAKSLTDRSFSFSERELVIEHLSRLFAFDPTARPTPQSLSLHEIR